MFAMECEVDVRVWFPVVFVSLHFLSRKDNMNLLNRGKIFFALQTSYSPYSFARLPRGRLDISVRFRQNRREGSQFLPK